MNRPFTVALAVLDALLVAVLGIGILLVPLTVLWLTQFELSVDYGAFWRVAANFWLLGNGVDLRVAIDPTLALRLAIDGAGVPFEIGFAPLGIAVLTLFLGYRAGSRLAGTEHHLLGAGVGILTVGLLGSLVALSARTPDAQPSPAQAALFPVLIYAIGMAASLYDPRRVAQGAPAAGREPPWIERWVRDRAAIIPATVRSHISLALRGGALAAAGIVAAAGVLVFLLIVVHYGEIISLYESLQSGLVGGIALTAGQLSLVPNLVIWAASWLVGPGFALGTGSSVSPLATHVGLLPSLPVLGALPPDAPGIGYVVLVLPVILGFAAGALLASRLADAPSGLPARSLGLLLTAGGIGVTGATILAVLALWSGGAAGPGRLADVGPDPVAVWLWFAVELTVSSALGLAAGLGRRLLDRSRQRAGPGDSVDANKL